MNCAMLAVAGSSLAAVAGSSLAVTAAVCVTVAVGALARVLIPAAPRAATRIRPYTAVARTMLGLAPDIDASHRSPEGLGISEVLFGPVRSGAHRVGRILESRSDEAVALRLYQAGSDDVSVADHRLAQVARGALFGAAFAGAGVVFVRTPLLVVVLAAVGFLAGAARVRGDVDRAIARRTERMELELGTVNQLRAMHVRSGSGPVQSVQRLVDRGHGAVLDELDAVLTWIRSGQREPDAFRRAAELTPCRDAARTYQLLGAAVERGTDLAAALLAIGDDLRDARRETLRKASVKRRAAMLAPTIGILAPIMLLFVAAPLPSIVLGNR